MENQYFHYPLFHPQKPVCRSHTGLGWDTGEQRYGFVIFTMRFPIRYNQLMDNPEEANEEQRSAESTKDRRKRGQSQNRFSYELFLPLFDKANPGHKQKKQVCTTRSTLSAISEQSYCTGNIIKGMTLDSSDSATKHTEQKELSWETIEYKEFKDSHESINMATIKKQLGDRQKYPYIQINTAQKELFESENKGQVRLQHTGEYHFACYYFYISCFRIGVFAYFQYRNLPFKEGSDSGSGSFGEVHFVKNSKDQEVCLKLIRFKGIQPYFALQDALKEFGMCKLADALGVGPHVQRIQTKEPFSSQLFASVDILVYYDGIAFQMEKCELVLDRIANQTLVWCQEQQKKIESELAEVMLTLHQVKIVHKDIKPANIVYSPSKGRYCLIDFGLSHSVKETYEGRTQTYYEGTPGYMSEEMQGLLKAEKRRGEVNLYYNDLHAYRHSLWVIRGYASGEKTMPAPSTIKDPQPFQIRKYETKKKQETFFNNLFYAKTTQGFSYNLQGIWMGEIRKMSSKQQREEELKRMAKYKKLIESSPQYKFQKRMDRWDIRTILGYQLRYQWEDIRALFKELSRLQSSQPDYEEVLRCLMNLRRVNGLIEVRFWKIETLLNDVIFPYIDDKYSRNQFKSLYYRIAQRVINLVDVEARTHQQLAEAQYQQELQGVEEDVNKLIVGYKQQEGLFELLCDLSEFCCHFNICSVLDATLEYLNFRNLSSPEEIVVLLARCVSELQKHPQKIQSKIAAYIQKIISITRGQRYREISQERYSFYQWFLLSIYTIQSQGMLQQADFHTFTAGVRQQSSVFSPELQRSVLYSIYLIQSSGNSKPISQFSEEYKPLLKYLVNQLLNSAIKIKAIQCDLQCSDSEQVSLIKPMFALLFHFIRSSLSNFKDANFLVNFKDTKFMHWLVQWLAIGPKYQSQTGGASQYLKPLLQKMSQEQLRYRVHMYFFPFHQYLVHSKVLKPLFCEGDQECEGLKERLIEQTYNITNWKYIFERMKQHLYSPQQITKSQNDINGKVIKHLRENPDCMQSLRSQFYQLNDYVNTDGLEAYSFILKGLLPKGLPEAQAVVKMWL